MNIGETLTRKLGPLPTWGWGVALGGGFLVWNFIRGGEPSSDSESPTFVNPDPGQQAAATQGFLNDLTTWMQRLEDRLGNVNTPPDSDETPTSGETPISNALPEPGTLASRTVTRAQLQTNLYRTLADRASRWTFARANKRTGETDAQAWVRIFGERGAGFQRLTSKDQEAPDVASIAALSRLLTRARRQERQAAQ